MSNIRDDFIKARYLLAKHKSGIKERLIEAASHGITSYDAEKLPPHLREDYLDLVNELTKGSENGYGSGRIEQTITGISEDDASMIAGQLMDFTTNLLNTSRSEFGY